MGHGAPGCGPPTMAPLELLLDEELEDELDEPLDDELAEDDELLDALDVEAPPLPPPELALDADDALEEELAVDADPPAPPAPAEALDALEDAPGAAPEPPPLDEAPDDALPDAALVVASDVFDAAGDDPHPAASPSVDTRVTSALEPSGAKSLFVLCTAS